MLRAKIGENIFHVTLSERESVTSSYYSMKLTPKEATTNHKTLRPVDLSVEGDRVNKIRVELVNDENAEDLPNGLVFLTGGDYIYEIFDDQDNLLERGVLLYDTEVEQSEYTGNNITEKVYKP